MQSEMLQRDCMLILYSKLFIKTSLDYSFLCLILLYNYFCILHHNTFFLIYTRLFILHMFYFCTIGCPLYAQ